MLNEVPPETATEVAEVLATLGQVSGMPTVLLTHIDRNDWRVWAIHDDAHTGLHVGTRLDVRNTLCDFVRGTESGLALDDVVFLPHAFDAQAWLARTGCEGAEAERVVELMGDRIAGGRLTLDKIAIKAVKG